MDTELQQVREKYEANLAELADFCATKTALVHAWAEANPEEFGKRKSIEFVHGTIGFRTGTPKLKTLLKWKWDMVLHAVKNSTMFKEFVRVKEELAKELILAAVSQGKLSETDLRAIGCQVVQEESFFVDPKLTETETRVTSEAA